jgi:uncharacterized membrane-anchored protein YhcB (DUF1043 family)
MKYSEELDNYTQELAKHVKTSLSKLDTIQQVGDTIFSPLAKVSWIKEPVLVHQVMGISHC